MAIKSKSELMDSIKSLLGESEDDVTLSLIEDITDTLDDFESKTKEQTDWQTKYQENDTAWRKKYRDRFFNATADEDENDDSEDEPRNKLSYDDLFKED